MAIVKGTLASVKLGTDTVLNCQSYALDIAQETVDTTKFGDTFRASTPTFATWSATAKGNFDIADSTGQAVLAAAALAGSEVADARFYVGTAPYYHGPAYVSMAISADVGGVIEVNFTFVASGALTYHAS